MNNQKDFKTEQAMLDSTIKNIEDRKYYVWEQTENKRNNKKKRTSLPGDTIAYRNGKREMSLLDQAQRNPYFGRIDFNSEEYGVETHYIGKQGIKNIDEDIVVVDWRMPLASIYYNYTPGEPRQSFKVEDKKNNRQEEFEVEVLQKREFTIKNKKLIKILQQVAKENSKLNKTFTDKGEELTVTDDFLREIIEKSETTGFLKEIIATIQHEQNKAIRQPISKNLIVQGAAGSGKSSIALHRLSFLLFNNKKVMPEDVLILGPSNLFISSFKDMLPELDLKGIQQSTFQDFALRYLKGKIGTEFSGSYHDFFESVLFKNDKKSKRKRIAFKGSEALARLIDIFVDEYQMNYKERFNNISFHGYILNRKDLEHFFEGYKYLPFSENVDKFIIHVQNYYRDILNKEVEKIKEHCDSITDNYLKRAGLTEKEFNELSKKMKDIFIYKKRVLEKDYKKVMAEFQDTYKIPDLVTIYKQILSYEILLSYQHELSEETINAFKDYSIEKISYFDLPPLLYLYFSLFGEPKKLTHIVVDEGQDFSYMHYAVLQQVTNTMTILGDKEQSIFVDYGQQDWKELRDTLFANREGQLCQLLTMETSYRSTKEIIDTANIVLSNQFPYRTSITPINRSGPDVSLEEVKNGEELMDNIKSCMQEWTKRYKRIAIIHKDKRKAARLAEYLQQELRCEVVYIQPDKEITNSQISVLASYNSKGMEFDAVLLVNVNKESFPKDDLHARLLYVLLTRAQKEVKAFYQDTPSALLDGLVKKQPLRVTRFDDIL
ncbi:HelD family protein [Virgibacillus senegalensis]|uniref:HelD family protein n=1 Tax=Virgibacillus senegalensis TaxID=1499679 RepID=UPI00069E354D|nr:3'-5' exonuclease [Virgibacillus senegalensis]